MSQTNTNRNRSAVFDYRALRLLMGIIALSLPWLVDLLTGSVELGSISASYWYHDARDVFVGSLFAVSAFLFAYNGHDLSQSIVSKVASLAALLVAIFPTAMPEGVTCGSVSTASVYIHRISAVILFAILAYIAWFPFRKKIKGKKGRKRLRSAIYMTASMIILACIAVGLLGLTLDALDKELKGLVYWAELIALTAFGIAWIVSGKFTRLIADEDELLRLLPTRRRS